MIPMNRIVGQASSLLESGRLEACPTTMAVHGSNVYPVLEVVAFHEPPVSDPARFCDCLPTSRVGDRRSDSRRAATSKIGRTLGP